MDSQVAGPSHVMDQQSPGMHSLRNARTSNNISGDMTSMDTRDNEIPDISLLCRICASTHEHLIPMFEGEGLENKLVDKIHSHLPIKVDNTDSLPDHVCYQCASTLLAWHDLVQCCIQSNITLLERVNRENTNKTAKTNQDQEKSAENGSQNSRGRSLRGSRPDTARQSASNVKRPSLADDSPGSLKKIPKTESGEFKIPNSHGCVYCGQSHPDSESLTAHLLDYHADLLFHCDVCGLYLDRKLLISHMSQHAEEQYANESNESNPVKSDPGNSAQISELKPLVSDVALVETNDDAFSISSHSNGRFEPIPDSVFEAIKDTEETGEPFVEPLPKTLEQTCEDMQKMSEKLSSRNVSSNEANRRICPICSKEFRVASSYHYHVKHFHGGVKDHSCNVCGRSFAVKSALTNHLTLHTGEKPYSCPQCGKQFRSKASIYIHYNNVHCDNKKFPCPTCNRSFRWKQKLLRHIASHTKEKKHFCPECKKGFGVKYDLTRHMKTHLKAKPYTCDKCGMNFAQRRYLKKHTEKKHSAAVK